MKNHHSRVATMKNNKIEFFFLRSPVVSSDWRSHFINALRPGALNGKKNYTTTKLIKLIYTITIELLLNAFFAL